MSPAPRSTRSRLLLAIPAIAFAALILYGSSRPNVQLPSLPLPSEDKVLHVAEYFVYGLLLLLPLGGLGWRGRGLALAVGVAYALFDEAYQTTVPGRFGDLADVAADAVGLLLAAAVEAGVSALWNRRGSS